MFFLTKICVLLVTINIISGDDCPEFIKRREWAAAEAKLVRPLTIDPPKYVVVHHTNGRTCNDTQICENQVNGIQNYALTERGFNDIPYNFLIGGDGNIYEGRGYGVEGEHSEAYDDRSLAVALIGNYTVEEPEDILLDTLEVLLKCFKNQGKVTPTFKLIGHGQSEYVSCPGEKLQKRIEQLPEWSPWAD